MKFFIKCTFKQCVFIASTVYTVYPYMWIYWQRHWKRMNLCKIIPNLRAHYSQCFWLKQVNTNLSPSVIKEHFNSSWIELIIVLRYQSYICKTMNNFTIIVYTSKSEFYMQVKYNYFITKNVALWEIIKCLTLRVLTLELMLESGISCIWE